MDLWRMLARRYTGKKVVFEILNEPIAKECAQWNDFARTVHAVIRSEAPDQWIMVSSNDWGHVNTFSRLSPIEDLRTVYTFHFYEPLLFTHQNAPWVSFMKMLEGIKVPYPGPFDHSILDIKTGFPMDFGFMKNAPYGRHFLESLLEPVIQFKNKNKVPVYCGEFGSVAWAPQEDRLHWYRDVVELFIKHGFGFANWDYKSDDFGIVGTSGVVDTKLLAVLKNAVHFDISASSTHRFAQ
jgi:endoglucanase